MNTFSYALKTLLELSDKLRAAGFTDGSFAQLVRDLPCLEYGCPEDGLARKLYFLHLGLAKFGLQPGVVKMYSDERYGDDERTRFSNGDRYWFKVVPRDLRFYEEELDLSTLFLLSPFGSSQRQITFANALRKVKAYPSKKISIGSFWHGEWLMAHQEFIPESWSKVVLQDGGRIIFPRVRLISKPSHGQRRKITYPYLASGTGGRYIMEYHTDLQASWEPNGEPEILRRGKDFFACYRRQAKE
jgi:hypothetical protein